MDRIQKLHIPHTWQSVNVRVAAILSTSEFSDITFVVGEDQKEFHAHKVILATASEVFKAMFYGFLSEKGSTVTVPDLEPSGFRLMLKFVYEDNVHFDSVHSAVQTLAVSVKYLMEHLKQICSSYLFAKVTPENACYLYEIACLFDIDLLKSESVQRFIFRTEEVIKSESFLYAQQSTVELILRQNYLQVSSELQLLNALLRWGQANSTTEEPSCDRNLRHFVSPLLPLIRFLTLSAEELAQGPEKSGILTDDEMLSLLVNKVSSGVKPLPEWVCRKLQRKSPMGNVQACTTCFENVHDSRLRAASLECNMTVSKKDAIIIGVAVFFSKHFPRHTRRLNDYKRVQFCLWNLTRSYDVTESILCKIDHSGFCTILLKNPTLICKGETCRIIIDFKTMANIGQCRNDCNYSSEAGVHFSITSQVAGNCSVHSVLFYPVD